MGTTKIVKKIASEEKKYETKVNKLIRDVANKKITPACFIRETQKQERAKNSKFKKLTKELVKETKKEPKKGVKKSRS